VEQVQTQLLANLCHRDDEIRLRSLEALTLLAPLEFKELASDIDEDSTPLRGECPLVDSCLALARMPITFHNERALTASVEKFGTWIRSGRLPKLYHSYLAHFLMGLYHVKYSPMWKVVTKVLATLAAQDFAALWPVMHAFVARVSEMRESAGVDLSVEVQHGHWDSQVRYV
jgi:hypothetical protein